MSKWIQDYRQSILVKRMIAVLGIDVLVKASGIILLPLYLRLMSQAEFGMYSYILSIVVTLSVVLNFGLYIPLSKLYHDCQNEAARGRLLFTVFLMLTIALSVLMVPIYLFRIDFLFIKILFKNPIDYERYRLAILLSVLATVFSFMLTNFFYTSEKINHLKKYNFTRIIGINLIAIGVLYVYRNDDHVHLRLVATYVVELVLAALFYYFCIREMRPQFNLNLISPSFKLGFPVMISAILGIVINFSDKFFLEKYGTLHELSVYYLAISFSGILATIYTSFQNAWLPLFFKEKDVQRNFDKTKRLSLRLLGAFTVLGFLILILMAILLATKIIQVKYQSTLFVLPILLVTQIISALVPVYSNYLIYFEKTYYTLLIGAGVCFVSLSLSFLLIPSLGMYGAALVSLVSNLCYLCAYFVISRSFKRNHLQLSTGINK
ncbi:MAG TPA: oligosaccharide flippase family protein [Chitinophagaceae bacterium]|nr:oligosaccharide flippase family protein [Chitinophagaceae bacterium]